MSVGRMVDRRAVKSPRPHLGLMPLTPPRDEAQVRLERDAAVRVVSRYAGQDAGRVLNMLGLDT